jgi:hypothetical protein
MHIQKYISEIVANSPRKSRFSVSDDTAKLDESESPENAAAAESKFGGVVDTACSEKTLLNQF